MSQGVNILLVDDRPENLLALEAMLEHADLNLVKAESGEEALAKLLDREFAVVLLDVQMPGMDGFETARLMRGSKSTRYVPIIFVTAISKEDQYVFEGYEAGAVDYLFKPLNAEIVRSKVRIFVELSEQKRALREAHAKLERAFRELDKKDRQIREDLKLARSIQNALLPRENLVFPPAAAARDDALRFCHRYLPIDELGGDFFDVHAVTEEEAVVFICDVMGHGVQAALMTAVIRGLVERVKASAPDPAALLTELNRSLVGVLDRPLDPVLTTAFCLSVHVRNRTVHSATAGHPLPFHLERRGKTPTLKSLPAPPGAALGLSPDSTYQTAITRIAPGDILFLYTDGLFEVKGHDSELLDVEGLEQIIGRHLERRPEELLDAVIEDVRAFSSENCFDDDICFVGMEFAPPGDSPGESDR